MAAVPHVPQIVEEELPAFEQTVLRYSAGLIPEDRFRTFRLRFGVYGQRQPGVYLVRVKIPGGVLTAGQMECLAEIAEDLAGGRAHLTTRQDLQFHFVPLEGVCELLRRLASAGLTTREACGNTVRNVTVCPLSGLVDGELFDVRPVAWRLAFTLLRNPLTADLPRKFKIAFCACPGECPTTVINDIGLRAAIQRVGSTERRGFAMTVGGGLGPLPVQARLLEEFVPEGKLLGRVEAVLRVFNRYGNRANKHKARLKFVLLERGWEWFRQAVEEQYWEVTREPSLRWAESVPDGFGGCGTAGKPPRQAGPPDGPREPDYLRWLESNVRAQKQQGYFVVTARIPQGNLDAAQMRALARAAQEHGDGLIRNSLEQNAMIAWVPGSHLYALWQALRKAGLGASGAGQIGDVVSCPGAQSCALALTKSMNLAGVLSEALHDLEQSELRGLRIKVSGCPNACGHHWIADVGLYGNARKIGGRWMPYYQLVLGGANGNGGFASAVGSVVGRLAPLAVRRVLEDFRSGRKDGESFGDYVRRRGLEHFRELVREFTRPAHLSDEMFRDWGDTGEFTVKLGEGECAV